MPDILPVSLQDVLHCWKPELREYKISIHTDDGMNALLDFIMAKGL